MGNFQKFVQRAVDEIENCDPGGRVWVDFRAADNFGFLVGKIFSLGNVMICRENNKNYRQEFFGF